MVFDLDFLPCVMFLPSSMRKGSGRNDSQVQYIKLSGGREVQVFLSTPSHFAFQYQFLRYGFRIQ